MPSLAEGMALQPVDDLTTTQGIVALGAAGVAVVALLWTILNSVRLRRLRAAQKTVLGDGGADLVDHAATLQEAFIPAPRLARGDGTAARSANDRPPSGASTGRSPAPRWFATTPMARCPGRQSSSLALLDSRRSGVVVSAIHHRDQARVYVKHLHEGTSEVELSPEEIEAVETAMAGVPSGA